MQVASVFFRLLIGENDETGIAQSRLLSALFHLLIGENDENGNARRMLVGCWNTLTNLAGYLSRLPTEAVLLLSSICMSDYYATPTHTKDFMCSKHQTRPYTHVQLCVKSMYMHT